MHHSGPTDLWELCLLKCFVNQVCYTTVKSSFLWSSSLVSSVWGSRGLISEMKTDAKKAFSYSAISETFVTSAPVPFNSGPLCTLVRVWKICNHGKTAGSLQGGPRKGTYCDGSYDWNSGSRLEWFTCDTGCTVDMRKKKCSFSKGGGISRKNPCWGSKWILNRTQIISQWELLSKYQGFISFGKRHAIPKARNLSKFYQVWKTGARLHQPFSAV